MSFTIGKRKKTYNLAFLAAASLVLVHLVAWIAPDIVRLLELRADDYLFKIRAWVRQAPEVVDPNLALIYIDDRDIQHYREGFHSGDLYTTINDLLGGCGVSSVGYDVIFNEKTSVGNMGQFESSVRRCGAAYLPVAFFNLPDGAVRIPPSSEPAAALLDSVAWRPPGAPQVYPVNADTPLTSTYCELLRCAKGIGVINATMDMDGIFRRLPPLIRYNDGYLPSLPFAMACDFLSVDRQSILIEPGRSITLPEARLPDGRKQTIVIPIDRQGAMVLNFPGKWEAYKNQYSLRKLLELAANKEQWSVFSQQIEGSIVLVAVLATGGGDLGPTATEANYPLVGLHLTVLNTILTRNFLSEIHPLVTFLIELLLVAAIGGLSYRLGIVGSLLVSLGIVLVYGLGSAALFIYARTIPILVVPVTVFVLCAGSGLTYRYFIEEQEERFVRQMFSNYFSPLVLEKIEKNPGLLSLGGEEKELTVMFTDIAGFTKWSSTQTPENIKTTLNEYFEEMATVVFSYDGYIDKYIGDGMLVFFGDVAHVEDHTVQCVASAIEMQKRIRMLHQRWAAAGGMPIRVRIGIHTGIMIVGNMGSKSRMDYTVLGANVNLAQRLESAAPLEGILVSQAVNEKIAGTIRTRSAGEITAKGYEKPIPVFEVLLDGP